MIVIQNNLLLLLVVIIQNYQFVISYQSSKKTVEQQNKTKMENCQIITNKKRMKKRKKFIRQFLSLFYFDQKLLATKLSNKKVTKKTKFIEKKINQT